MRKWLLVMREGERPLARASPQGAEDDAKTSANVRLRSNVNKSDAHFHGQPPCL